MVSYYNYYMVHEDEYVAIIVYISYEEHSIPIPLLLYVDLVAVWLAFTIANNM